MQRKPYGGGGVGRRSAAVLLRLGDDTMWGQIEQVLDEHVRPALREHCGEVKVTRIEMGTVYVRLLGQCASCASVYYTVDELLERVLKEYVPGVERVLLDDSIDVELYQYAKQLLNKQKQSLCDL